MHRAVIISAWELVKKKTMLAWMIQTVPATRQEAGERGRGTTEETAKQGMMEGKRN